MGHPQQHHRGQPPRGAQLAATTGLRRGELVAVTWDDVDLDRRRLWVRRSIVTDQGEHLVKAPKSEAGMRQVGLDASTVLAMKKHRAKLAADALAGGAEYESLPMGLDLAFRWNASGSLCRPDSVSHAFTSEWSHARLPPGPTLHSLRHSLGSLLLSLGHPITEAAAQLGHTPQVLLAIYGRDLDAEARADRVSAAAGELFG